MNGYLVVLLVILIGHIYIYYTLKEGLIEKRLVRIPDDDMAPPSEWLTKGKYVAAYKATGCTGKVNSEIINWWKEKKTDGEIWKDMMNRCQDSLKKNGEDECGAGLTCNLQTLWGKYTPIHDNVMVAPPNEHPRQQLPLAEQIPSSIKKNGPPIQIPAHTHNPPNKEQNTLILNIRQLLNKMKEKIKKDDIKHDPSLTPEQYKLWKKAVGAIKLPKKKRQTQPISVNVDVTDEREVHYEMAGAPGIVGKNQLKKLIKTMNLSDSARAEIMDEMKKHEQQSGVKRQGAAAPPPAAGDSQPTLQAKNATQSKSKKFNDLKQKATKSPYIAYNDEDYG